jgi:hypothetical protein
MLKYGLKKRQKLQKRLEDDIFDIVSASVETIINKKLTRNKISKLLRIL